MLPPDSTAEFALLWNAASRRVYAYIYSLVGNGTDADDIFQETGLVVLAKFGEFQPGTHFGAWACRIAYHKVMQHFQQQRLQSHLDASVLEALHLDSLAMTGEAVPAISALDECLTALPAKDRTLIRLRYRSDQTVEAIALRVGRTTSAVYKALNRIHEQLLGCISGKLAEEDRS